jgi:hypothetical protein
VAYLEGLTSEHSSAISELRLDMRDLRAEMNRRFDHMETRFDHIDTRFMWMIGFQFATLMAVIAALLNVYFR